MTSLRADLRLSDVKPVPHFLKMKVARPSDRKLKDNTRKLFLQTDEEYTHIDKHLKALGRNAMEVKLLNIKILIAT